MPGFPAKDIFLAVVSENGAVRARDLDRAKPTILWRPWPFTGSPRPQVPRIPSPLINIAPGRGNVKILMGLCQGNANISTFCMVWVLSRETLGTGMMSNFHFTGGTMSGGGSFRFDMPGQTPEVIGDLKK